MWVSLQEADRSVVGVFTRRPAPRWSSATRWAGANPTITPATRPATTATPRNLPPLGWRQAEIPLSRSRSLPVTPNSSHMPAPSSGRQGLESP